MQILKQYQVYCDSILGKYGPNKPNVRQVLKVSKVFSFILVHICTYVCEYTRLPFFTIPNRAMLDWFWDTPFFNFCGKQKQLRGRTAQLFRFILSRFLRMFVLMMSSLASFSPKFSPHIGWSFLQICEGFHFFGMIYTFHTWKLLHVFPRSSPSFFNTCCVWFILWPLVLMRDDKKAQATLVFLFKLISCTSGSTFLYSPLAEPY